MTSTTQLDHLFRHQYGKMVAVLTGKFGLQRLESIEDAVQDTFISAMRSWPQRYPDNPESWLMRAAINRMLDILRKNTAEQSRFPKSLPTQEEFWHQQDPVLDDEISDSQLRMIFTACHPELDTRDQIAFALKTISGFSEKEISTALLQKPETVKKRLQRARKAIRDSQLQFDIPTGKALPLRLDHVHLIIYLIFNEGFHSNKRELLIREEICGEATRLCRMLVSNPGVCNSQTYALFALLCFQSARLRTKTNSYNEVVSLKNQDRSAWYAPLISLGNSMMHKAVQSDEYSRYHYEAAIAYEHVRAKSYEETDWQKLLMWYQRLDSLEPSPLNKLSMAMIHLQLKDYTATWNILTSIDSSRLQQRSYLFHGLKAEYFMAIGDNNAAREHLSNAIDLVSNEAEKRFLEKKLARLSA